jgi:hypothetical protein
MRNSHGSLQFVSDTYFVIEGNSVLADSYTGVLPDSFYVHGWIDLRIGSSRILGEEHKDLVDQLWVYLLEGIDKLASGCSQWEFGFPDQPTDMLFALKKHRSIEIRIGSEICQVRFESFIVAVTSGAEKFFSKMKILVPKESRSWDLFIRQCKALNSKT